jgi:hypothetical protein
MGDEKNLLSRYSLHRDRLHSGTYFVVSIWLGYAGAGQDRNAEQTEFQQLEGRET